MWPRSLAVRSVGAGDVSLERSAARGIDAFDLSRAVHATLEAGIDVVDIAAEEDAERLVGDALRALRMRDRALPLTRVPAIGATASGTTTSDLLRERLPLRYLVDRIERTLRATRLDALPLALIELRAAWRESRTWPELVDTCARLVRDGKVLAFGAYIDQIEDDTPALLDESWLVAISVPYSLCERNAEAVIARALELRVRAADTSTTADNEAAGSSGRAGAGSSGTAGPSGSSGATPTSSFTDVDPRLAAAAASDPNIAAVLASSLTGVSDQGLAGLLTGSRTGVSDRGAHPSVDPRFALNDPVVAAALARDPKLAAALGIRLPDGPGHDIAILARRPLAGGALAGKLGPGVKMRKDDDRRLDAQMLERIAVGVAKLSALVKETPPAARSCAAAKQQLERNERPEHVECVTVPELALRFAIDRGTIPLVRLQHREHVADALAAAISPPLPRDLTEKLDI